MWNRGGRVSSFILDGTCIPEETIFGRSEPMQRVRTAVERVASTSVPVLIQGESGTGKEVIAKDIHRRSPWADGPFVKVSCPAIPATLLESELFGYEKGAFTGAWNAKPGRVELADPASCFWFRDLRFFTPGRDAWPFEFGVCRQAAEAGWSAFQLLGDTVRMPLR